MQIAIPGTFLLVATGGHVPCLKFSLMLDVFVQEHVMIFSFILCVGLQQSEGKVNTGVWAFLLTGGSKLPKESLFPNPAPQWLRSVLSRTLLKSQKII